MSRDTVSSMTPEQLEVMEKAANLVLDSLPGYLAETIREMAYVHNRQPLWAFVAGHLVRAYENGELSAPIMDPSWPRLFTDVPDPLKATYQCEHCRAAFVPRRWRQKYCSNECGTAAQTPAEVKAG